MKLSLKRIIPVLLLLILVIAFLAGRGNPQDTTAGAEETLSLVTDAPEEATPESTETETAETPQKASEEITSTVEEDGIYDGKDEVAEYIHVYGHLPSNYITKAEARKLGWEGGSLKEYAPGKCIGGDYFGNYEGSLPTKKGRTYYECDIDTLNWKNRGSRRIIYSNDGLIYYTGDHYETFQLLYGEE